MSHIAFDLDALPLVPKVARSAGIGEAVVGWGLTQMWEWCWREKTDQVTTNHLRGFFGAEIGAIMVDFGFLEAIGSSLWRVRGAARYLRIQAGREKGGRAAAAAGNLKRGSARQAGAPSQLAPSTFPAGSQHTSQLDPRLSATSDERRATSDERLAVAGSRKKRATPAPEAPPDPRHSSMVKALTERFEQVVGSKYPFTGRDAKAVTQLLALAIDPTILAAWDRALRHTEFPTVRTLAELVTHFAHFVGVATTGPPATYRRDEPNPKPRPEGRVRIEPPTRST